MRNKLLSSAATIALLSCAAVPAMGAGNILFWGEYINGSVGRVDADGTNATNILVDVAGGGVGGVAVDQTNQKVYWVNYAGGGSGSNIQRANLDGSTVETPISATGDTGKWDVAVDSTNGKVYWTTWPNSGIFVRSANLDGSGLVTLTNSTVYGAGVEVDPTAAKAYWSSFTNNSVRQSNLDGSGAIDFITGVTQPGYMTIDNLHHYLYYGTDGGSLATNIYRKSLTTAAAPELIGAGVDASDLAIDPYSGMLYYTKTTGTQGIYKIDLNGSFPASSSLVYDLSSQALVSGLAIYIVPEPASASLLALGCLLLARRRRSGQ